MRTRGGWRARLWRGAGAAIALAAAVMPGAAASAAPLARADVNDFSFESMDVVYRLAQDEAGHATLDVVETIVAVFPEFDQNRGFYRDIPEYYGGVEEGWVRLDTRADSVVDENGNPVLFTVEYYQDFFSIGLGDDSFVHGEQTYVIHYTQRNTSRSFPATESTPAVDEFYWDVNGTGWSQPFGRVSAEVRVDPALVPALYGTAACYAGPYGATESCPSGVEVSEDPATGEAIYRASAADLAPEETLSIAIAFEVGTFTPGDPATPPSQSYDDGGGWEPVPPLPAWIGGVIGVLAPGAVLIGAAARLFGGKARWRTHRASDIIIPQYEGPDAPIQLAARLAGHPDRAFAAQVIDLAVRRKIRILDDPGDSADSFELELVDPSGLTGYDEDLVQLMFGGNLAVGKRFSLDNQTKAFRSGYDAIRKRAEKELSSDGWMLKERATTPSRVMRVAGGATALGAWGLHVYVNATYDNPVGLIPALAATWGGWQALSRSSTTRDLTEKGKQLNDHLLGLRDYLTLAEEDRLRVLQSVAGAERVRIAPDDRVALVKLYERLLPWAVVWGVERSWGDVVIAQAASAAVPLEWVSTPSQLTQWRMFEALSSVSRVAPAPPAPPRSNYSGGGGWASSGSSSFSSGSFGGGGGGFSGGGGGGGGGRGR